MAISFTIQHIPDLKKGEGHFLSVAHDFSSGTYGTDTICTQICARSTLSPADVKAALDSLAWVIQRGLSEGYHINLEGIGYFSPSLRTKTKDGNKRVIEVDGINFACDRRLLDGVRHVELKRDYRQEKELRKADEKDWTEDALAFAKQLGYLTPNLYRSLTGCSWRRAAKALADYVGKGLLVKEGRGSRTLYHLPPGGE